MKPYKDTATQPKTDTPLFAAGYHLTPSRLAMQDVKAYIAYCMAGAALAVVGNARVIGVPAWHDKGSRVDQNLAQPGVVIRRAVQDQQAGLGCNRHADLVGDL